MKDASDKPIHFHYLASPFYFPNREVLKIFLVRQFKLAKRELSAVNYIFCTDAYLLQINQQYLKHDNYTDIITFELSPKTHPLVSDIYISIERIRDNAITHQSTFSQELHRVIFHGALHLIGYSDKSKAKKAIIRQKEDAWLNNYFVSRATVSLRNS